MFHIRLGNHHKEEVHTRKLLEEIKKHPGCCDVVWFASEYGYPMLQTHQDAAEKMCRLAQLYREQGIQVDLQISNTIGHGEYMKARDCSAIDAYGFEKIVGHDGTVANHCFCWYGENFRKYNYEMMKMYAALKPVNIWIDDDFTACNHAPVKYGCFCDSCVARFNDKYGSNFTREELVKIFAEKFIQKPRSYWLEVLSANDIAHEAIMHFKDVPNDEQAWANNYLIDHEYPNGQHYTFSHNPVTFASMELPEFHHCGPLGAHTEEILLSLGYSQEEIDQMVADNAVLKA